MDLKAVYHGVLDKGRGEKILANLFCTNICVLLVCVGFVTPCLGSSGWQMDANAFWPQGGHAERTHGLWLCDKSEKPSLRGLQVCERSPRVHARACAERTTLI